MYLRAGKLHMLYDRGFLRYIKNGSHEVLRMIYFALRDHNWDTMPGELEDEVVNRRDDSFEISYKWVCSSPDFPFVWNVKIQGKNTSEVIFEIEGLSGGVVRKNRTGFCILHSVEENAGNPCIVVDPDGSEKEGVFPKLISPHQPFFNITQMRWPQNGRGVAQLDFEGDVFEMEDQRNWTDDSYKTYCTPLSKPFPVELQKGEKVWQRVTLSLPEVIEVAEFVDDTGFFGIKDENLKKPSIGISASSETLQESDLKYLQYLNVDHYSFDLDLAGQDWQAVWNRGVQDAENLRVKLFASIFFSKDASSDLQKLKKLVQLLPEDKELYLLILHHDHKCTPDSLVDLVEPEIKKLNRKVKVGAGTAAYFTELNRNRVSIDKIDFVAFSVNPQVHAFDDLSLTENAIAQEYTVQSAHAYFQGKEIFISPITLLPRFNPNATEADEQDEGDSLPDSVDIRQMQIYGAAWTLSSLVALSSGGADLITYFETTGWKGVMQGDNDPQSPLLFPSERGMLFPVYHVLATVLRNQSMKWSTAIFSKSTKLLDVKGLVFSDPNQTFLLACNLGIESHSFFSSRKIKSIALLDGTTVGDAHFDPEFFIHHQKLVPGPESKSLNLPPRSIIYAELV